LKIALANYHQQISEKPIAKIAYTRIKKIACVFKCQFGALGLIQNARFLDGRK